jgi:hypothetical protein
VLPYSEDLDADKIHVQAPSGVILLCGGPCSDINSPRPRSLRDAFLKIISNPALGNRTLILPEDISSNYDFFQSYKDLLQFETHLAQITDLIILFSESEGSLAELGAFSMLDEIASRLLVIIRDKHWDNNSFVKLGPIRALENKYGQEVICVIDDEDINLRDKIAEDVRIDVLKLRLQEPIQTRLQKTREPRTFDRTREGHIIKLIVGLIQEYGGLTLEEIIDLLRLLNIDSRSPVQVLAYLLCAEAVNWIVKSRKGTRTYYFARNLLDAATLVMKDGSEMRNKGRRRLLIREHWGKTDQLRAKGIREIFGVAVGE